MATKSKPRHPGLPALSKLKITAFTGYRPEGVVMSDHHAGHDHDSGSSKSKKETGDQVKARRAIIVQMPPNSFGRRVTMGRPHKQVLYHGPHAKLPFFSQIEWWSMDYGPDNSFEVSFPSLDGLGVTIKGSVQWRPDPRVKIRTGKMVGHMVFPTMTPEAISKELEDGVANVVGAIGGTMNGEAFRSQRTEVYDLLNSVLRLSCPLHEDHNPATCGLAGCTYEAGWIPVEHQLAFYKAHHTQVRALLAAEEEDVKDASEVELTYGIDIRALKIAEVDFDEETKKALAEGQQAKIRRKPMNEWLRAVRRIKKEGYGSEAAGNIAATILGGQDSAPRTTNVIEVSGLSQLATVLGGLLGKNNNPNP